MLSLHSLKVAQLLRSAVCLHTNQSQSYLNHLVCSAVGLGLSWFLTKTPYAVYRALFCRCNNMWWALCCHVCPYNHFDTIQASSWYAVTKLLIQAQVCLIQLYSYVVTAPFSVNGCWSRIDSTESSLLHWISRCEADFTDTPETPVPHKVLHTTCYGAFAVFLAYFKWELWTASGWKTPFWNFNKKCWKVYWTH